MRTITLCYDLLVVNFKVFTNKEKFGEEKFSVCSFVCSRKFCEQAERRI
jgi:hypothetical protein